MRSTVLAAMDLPAREQEILDYVILDAPADPQKLGHWVLARLDDLRQSGTPLAPSNTRLVGLMVCVHKLRAEHAAEAICATIKAHLDAFEHGRASLHEAADHISGKLLVNGYGLTFAGVSETLVAWQASLQGDQLSFDIAA
jgi:hypothetical protein